MTPAQAAAVRRVLLAIDQAVDAFTEGATADTADLDGLCQPGQPASHPREELADVSTMGHPGWLACKRCGARFQMTLPPIHTLTNAGG